MQLSNLLSFTSNHDDNKGDGDDDNDNDDDLMMIWWWWCWDAGVKNVVFVKYDISFIRVILPRLKEFILHNEKFQPVQNLPLFHLETVVGFLWWRLQMKFW